MILLTGFGGFDRFRYNPSGRLARELSEEFGYPHEILRVSYEEAPKALREAYERHKPRYIVSFGLAAGRNAITLEKFALNRKGPKADVDGVRPYGIISDGPAALMTSLPVEDIVEAIRGSGIPARVSFHAGTYLCNLVFYEALRLTKGEALFVHVPADYELAISHGLDVPAMPFESLLKAGRIVLEKIVP